MSADAPIFDQEFPVGKRYRVRFLAPAVAPGEVRTMLAEWSPRVPERLSAAELHDYRAARTAALQAIAERLGGVVACVET